MKNLIQRIFLGILNFFQLGVAANTANFTSTYRARAEEVTADVSALYGMFAFRKNVNDWDANSLVSVPTTASTTPTLTVAQFFANFIDFASSAGGGITLTTPTVAQILAALPATVPQNGFNYMMTILNDNTGQTITVAAGANVTLVGASATIANNVARSYLVNINVGAGTVTMISVGSGQAL